MPDCSCPHCAGIVHIPDDLAGLVVICPSCEGAVEASLASPLASDAVEDAVEPVPHILYLRKSRSIAGWWGGAASLLSVAALAFFFLPLVEIRGKVGSSKGHLVAAQSGLQAICGEASSGEEGERVRLRGLPAVPEEGLKASLMMIAYPPVLLIGAVFALVPVSAATRFSVAFLSGAVAIGLLFGQILVEFPVAPPLIELTDAWGISMFLVHYTPWMGLSFVCLAVGIILAAVEFRVANRPRPS